MAPNHDITPISCSESFGSIAIGAASPAETSAIPSSEISDPGIGGKAAGKIRVGLMVEESEPDLSESDSLEGATLPDMAPPAWISAKSLKSLRTRRTSSSLAFMMYEMRTPPCSGRTTCDFRAVSTLNNSNAGYKLQSRSSPRIKISIRNAGPKHKAQTTVYFFCPARRNQSCGGPSPH